MIRCRVDVSLLRRDKVLVGLSGLGVNPLDRPPKGSDILACVIGPARRHRTGADNDQMFDMSIIPFEQMERGAQGRLGTAARVPEPIEEGVALRPRHDPGCERWLGVRDGDRDGADIAMRHLMNESRDELDRRVLGFDVGAASFFGSVGRDQ